jgi:(S)-2-hydroxy-acid oxidase
MQDKYTVKDFENAAQERLTKHAWDYYRSGANGMVSLKDSELAFDRIQLKGKAVVDSSKFEGTQTEVMGIKVPSPIFIASTAFHRMASVEGECDSSAAANKSKTPFMLSSWATTKAEDVAKSCPDSLKLFQIYMSKIPEVNVDIWRRVRESGFKILALTTDT